MTYQYQPLLSSDSIRVACLHPGSYNAEICIWFQARRLKRDSSLKLPNVFGRALLSNRISRNKVSDKKLQGDVFDYEALSYVWGTSNDPSDVRVAREGLDQGVLSISQNLDVALRHLRHVDGFRFIWIDALCINQEDDTEKSYQVAMMGKIYSMAKRVIAWLGPQEIGDQSDKAFDLLRQWNHHTNVDWHNYTLRPSKHSNDPNWGDRSVKLPYKAGELDSIFNLLARPYFTRTWVLQEVGLATSNAIVRCGHEELLWEHFRSALTCLQWKGCDPVALRADHRYSFGRLISSALDVCYMAPESLRLSELRLSIRNTLCRNPLDRLYAVLSLLEKADQDLHITPAYDETVENIYINVACLLAQKHRDLNFLATCELSTSTLDIPTWVPDWSRRLRVPNLPHLRWSACGWISAHATFVPTRNTMRVAGVLAGCIEHVTRVELDEFDAVHDDILKASRDINSALGSPNADWLTMYCSTLKNNDFKDAWIPTREDKPGFVRSKRFLEYILSCTTSWAGLPDAVKADGQMFLEQSKEFLNGRCFFSASEGRIGLAPMGTKPGDVVCVILGCDYPIVLRPSSTPQQTWLVVGACYAHGLMDGEVIYPDHALLSRKYRPLRHMAQPASRIKGWDCALYDLKKQRPVQNPAKILAEVGVKVERFQREPHVLEVLPETLSAAGVALQYFDLI